MACTAGRQRAVWRSDRGLVLSSASELLHLLFQLAWAALNLLTIVLAITLVRTRSVPAMILLIGSACLHLFTSALSAVLLRSMRELRDVNGMMLLSFATQTLSFLGGVLLLASVVALALRKTDQRV